MDRRDMYHNILQASLLRTLESLSFYQQLFYSDGEFLYEYMERVFRLQDQVDRINLMLERNKVDGH